MLESALNVGKTTAYTISRPSQVPLECISHISVKGHLRERTGLYWSLFFFSPNVLIKNKVFDGKSCVMSLLVLPAPVAGGRLLWEGNISQRQLHWAPWVFPLATGTTHRHNQPPLLGHPQVHPWQPTQPHAQPRP